MVEKVDDPRELSFLQISGEYKNHHVLVRVLSSDHKTGYYTGKVLYKGTTDESLYPYAREEGGLEKNAIIAGDNLVPILGGLLL